jgi:3-phenylpropionate/trans-cinnamate dioxygenase ferredoxin reductase subunit
MRHVIVGAGLAAVRAADAMRLEGFTGEILMLGEEEDLPYERPALSKDFLLGRIGADAIVLQPETFYGDRDIELRLGERAVALDAHDDIVVLAGGERVRFDRLLIATGAKPRLLPLEGATLEGVHYLRTLFEARRLQSELVLAKRVVVIGAGLVGLEVAAAARKLGSKVTVLEVAPSPLFRLLGTSPLGAAIAELHRDHGVDVRLSTSVHQLRGRGVVEEVVLSHGEVLEADLVVIGVGVKPATSWLRGSGLATGDGVLVSEHAETSRPGVFAAGDVARFWNPRYGVHMRLEQYGHAHNHGLTAGRAMAGRRLAYAPVPASSSEQYGRRIQATGVLAPGQEMIVRGSLEKKCFTAFFVRGARIEAVFSVDRPRDVLTARRYVEGQADVDVCSLSDEGIHLTL